MAVIRRFVLPQGTTHHITLTVRHVKPQAAILSLNDTADICDAKFYWLAEVEGYNRSNCPMAQI